MKETPSMSACSTERIMYFVVSLLVIVSNFHLTGAHIECCLPSKIEGQRFFVEDQVIKYFVSDYTVNRIYDTFDPDGDVFDIYDLETSRIYHFNGSVCSFENTLNAKRFSQCITNEADFEITFNMGRAQGGVPVFGKVKKAGNIDQFYVVTSNGAVCFLLMLQNKGPMATQTAVFSNVRSSISNRKIYTNVDNCVQKK